MHLNRTCFNIDCVSIYGVPAIKKMILRASYFIMDILIKLRLHLHIEINAVIFCSCTSVLTYHKMLVPFSPILEHFSAVLISHGTFPPKNSEKMSHSSPIRAIGVFFLVSFFGIVFNTCILFYLSIYIYCKSISLANYNSFSRMIPYGPFIDNITALSIS